MTDYWEEFLGEYNPRTPPYVIILGDVGQGKTGAMASINDEYHSKHGLDAYMLAKKDELKHFPEWWYKVNPENIKIPYDAMFNADDIHKYYHAREWSDGKVKDFDTLGRERGHTGTMLVLTSQTAGVVDLNLVEMLTCLIIKKPPYMTTRSGFGDRRGIGKFIRAADTALEYDEPEKAYIVSNYARFEGVIDNIPLPGWWTDETSTLHRGGIEAERKDRRRNQNINTAGKILKSIGRTFR